MDSKTAEFENMINPQSHHKNIDRIKGFVSNAKNKLQLSESQQIEEAVFNMITQMNQSQLTEGVRDFYQSEFIAEMKDAFGPNIEREVQRILKESKRKQPSRLDLTGDAEVNVLDIIQASNDDTLGDYSSDFEAFFGREEGSLMPVLKTPYDLEEDIRKNPSKYSAEYFKAQQFNKDLTFEEFLDDIRIQGRNFTQL